MRYLLLLTLGLCAITASAQQDPIYAQYMNNPFIINPAFGGLHTRFGASVAHRQQWTGMEGPNTTSFTADVGFASNRMAIGVIAVADRIGASSNTTMALAYAYHVPLNSNGATLSFGIQGGATNYNTDNSKLDIFDASDPMFQGQRNVWHPDFGAGLSLTGKRYSIGVSVPRMLENSSEFNGLPETLYARHYYLTAAYVFNLSDRLAFRPSALIRYVAGAPASADFNAALIFDKSIQAGVFTRNLNDYGVQLRLALKDCYRLGYVFEMPTGTNVGSRFVTHEVSVSLRLRAFDYSASSALF